MNVIKVERRSDVPFGVDNVKEEGTLVLVRHPHDLLGDVLTRAAHTTHRKEDVVVEEVLGQNLRSKENLKHHTASRSHRFEHS